MSSNVQKWALIRKKWAAIKHLQQSVVGRQRLAVIKRFWEKNRLETEDLSCFGALETKFGSSRDISRPEPVQTIRKDGTKKIGGYFLVF